MGQSTIASPQFSPDSRRLAAVGQTWLKIWNLQGKLLHTVTLPQAGRASDLAFSPDGQTLATVDSEALHLWSSEGKLLRTISPIRHEADFLSAVAFSPDGQMLATTSWQQELESWQIHLFDLNGHEIKVLPGHQGEVRHLSFSRDGKILITGSFDQTIALWDLSQSLANNNLTLACQWAADYLISQANSTAIQPSLCQP